MRTGRREWKEIKKLCLKLCCIAGLLIRNNEQLRIAGLTLINALISTPEDLDFRMHLRNEFMRVGLIDVLDVRDNASTSVQS